MLGIELDIHSYLDRLKLEVDRVDAESLQQLADLIFDCWRDQKQVFVFGNGGSGTTASHIAEDLGKGLLTNEELMSGDQKRLKVMSLTDNCGWLLAVGNDLSYDQVFVQQLMNYGSDGDLVIAISGSGNSPNVINAVNWARDNGLTTFAMTGFDGGKLKNMQDAGLHVQLDDMGMVESLHLAVYHWVLNDVFARIHQAGRYQ